MKLAIVLLALLTVASFLPAQEWSWQNTLVQGANLACVTFTTDGRFGWATSDYGDVIATTNRGTTWTSRLTRSGFDLQHVVFVDSAYGWAVARDNPSLMQTTDGGRTWYMEYSYAGSRFEDLAFVSRTSGWAISSNLLLHTSDGGENWVVQDSLDDGHRYSALSFVSATEGWAAGPTLLHTTNGGTTWSVAAQNCPIQGRMKFLSSGNGWGLTSDGGTLMGTTNRGVSWTVQRCGTDTLKNMLDVDFASDSLGRAVGTGGRIYRTMNGSAWVLQTSGTAGDLHSVIALTGFEGWAAGDGGVVLHTTDCGNHWSAQAGNPVTAGYNLEAVEFADSLNGWTAGGGGLVLRTTDGGRQWTQISTGHSFEIRNIAVLNPQTIWVAGLSDTVLCTSDGGATWSYRLFGNSDFYFAWPLLMIRHAGADHLWLVADSLYRSTDGGATWTGHLPGLTGEHIYREDLVFTDVNNGWMAEVGEEHYGFIYHTTDGGNTWNLQCPMYTWILALSFINSTTGWAITETDTVLHTTNGGTAWNPLVVPGLYWPGTVQFSDAQNGWIIIGSGFWGSLYTSLLRTTDGGITWDSVSTPCANGLAGVSFPAVNLGWAVGRNGAILHYAGASPNTAHSTASPARNFALAAYPNPFNPTTVLSFDVPASSRVRLAMHDITGRLVRTLADRVYSQGNYRVTFDGSDLPSGIYFARMQGKNFSKTQKLVLLK